MGGRGEEAKHIFIFKIIFFPKVHPGYTAEVPTSLAPMDAKSPGRGPQINKTKEFD